MQWTVIINAKVSETQVVSQITKYPSRSKAGKAVQVFCNSNKGCKVDRNNNTCTYTITR